MYLGINTADPHIVWKIIPSKTRNMQFTDKTIPQNSQKTALLQELVYSEHQLYVNFLVKFFKTAL